MVVAREMERLPGSARSIWLSEGVQRGKTVSVQVVPWCNGEQSGL